MIEEEILENPVNEGAEEAVNEILQLLAYPEAVVDLPEMQIMHQRAIVTKPKLEKYKKEFFVAVCCLVGIQVGRMPTTNLQCVYQSCSTIYTQLLEGGGLNLLSNTIGLFIYLPNQTFPAEIYQYLVDFCTKEINKESRAAAKATKVVVSEVEAAMILRGKSIFDTYSSTRTAINNTMNPLFREPKSGENISGVLLQIRMTLHQAHLKNIQREKFMRESRSLPEFKQKSKSVEREAWITKKLSDYVNGEFDVDWYPSGWMIFCLCGVPAGNRCTSNQYQPVFVLNSAISNLGAESVEEFDPAKRAAKSIGDHLVSVRELGLSRDVRREASRSAGMTDSAAKKGSAMTTPVTNTSTVNVSSLHTALYAAYYFFHTPTSDTCSH